MISAKQRMNRLKKEDKMLEERLPHDEIKRVERDDEKWVFSLRLPQTPYKKGTINLEFLIPNDYPSKEPQVFVRNQQNLYHPNIYHTGRVCYYHEQSKPGPNLFISDRITMIRHVLSNPNPMDMSNQLAGKLYQKDPKLWFEAAQKTFESKK